MFVVLYVNGAPEGIRTPGLCLRRAERSGNAFLKICAERLPARLFHTRFRVSADTE